MEKKTILAFVLSLAVLILWSILFAPKPAQKTDAPPVEGITRRNRSGRLRQQTPGVQKMESLRSRRLSGRRKGDRGTPFTEPCFRAWGLPSGASS
jgi:hypothetical protein